MDWKQAIVELMPTVIIPLVGASVAWAMKKLADWAAAKAVNTAYEGLVVAATGVAQGIWHEWVKHAKAAAADGKLTPSEKRRFATLAWEALMLQFAGNAAVFGGKKALESAVQSAVELGVKNAKTQNSIPLG